MVVLLQRENTHIQTDDRTAKTPVCFKKHQFEFEGFIWVLAMFEQYINFLD